MHKRTTQKGYLALKVKMASETHPIFFSEKPYAAIVSEDYFQCQNLCSSCFKLHPHTFRCAKCRLVCYCGVECQTEDWKSGQHRRECKVFASIPQTEHSILKDSVVIRLVARVLARKDKDHGITDGSELVADRELMKLRKLSDLCSNAENLAVDVVCRAWMSFAFLYRSRSKFFEQFEVEEFRLVFGWVQTNAFGIHDYDILEGRLSLGSGLYLQSSRFNHSCDPDLSSVQEGSSMMRFRLLKPIDMTQPNLDSLTYSYLGALRSGVSLTAERRAKLESSYYFKCECTICQNEKLDRIKECSVVDKCPKCEQNLVVTLEGEAQFECLHCGNKAPGKEKDAKAVRALIIKLRKIFYKEADVEKIQGDLFSFIGKAAKRLDPLRNIWLLRLCEDLSLQHWESFESVGKEAPPLFCALYGNANSFVLKTPEGAQWYKEFCEMVCQVVATYRFYGVNFNFFPTECAKLAQVLEAAGEKAQAKPWLEEARDLWANVVCSPGHHCVADIQAKIDNL